MWTKSKKRQKAMTISNTYWSRPYIWSIIQYSVFKVLRASIVLFGIVSSSVYDVYVKRCSKWRSYSFPVWEIYADSKERLFPISQLENMGKRWSDLCCYIYALSRYICCMSLLWLYLKLHLTLLSYVSSHSSTSLYVFRFKDFLLQMINGKMYLPKWPPGLWG